MSLSKVLPGYDEYMIPIWSHNGKIICAPFIKEDGSSADDKIYPHVMECHEVFERNPVPPKTGSVDKCINDSDPFICTKDEEAPIILYWTPTTMLHRLVTIALNDVDSNLYKAYSGDCGCNKNSNAFVDIYVEGWIVQVDVDFYKCYKDVSEVGSTLTFKIRILRMTEDYNDKFGVDFSTGYLYYYEVPEDIHDFIKALKDTIIKPESIIERYKD